MIVGAGAWGLASAYHLAEADPRRTVLVVEARAGPGEGSMAASSSMVRDVFSSWDNRVLARSSIAFYRHLRETHDALRSPQPLLDLYGYLWLLSEPQLREYRAVVAQSDDAIDAVPVEMDALRTCPGLDPAPSDWYEGDRAPPPAPIAGGLFGRTCGALAPELLARFYFEEAQRRGVDFAFASCVQRLSFEGREEILLHEGTGRPFAFQENVPGRLRIARVGLGDGRSVRTDTVVVAAGGWAERILHPLGFATACTPRPQSLFSVSGPSVEELLRWEPPVVALDREEGRSRLPFLVLPTGATLKPVPRARHLWLGCVDTVARPIGTREDPGRDGVLDYDPGRLADRASFATDLLPAVTPYLPRLGSPSSRLERGWGGYYHFSPDGLPVLTEERFGVIFVGGDSGSGIMKADALGRLVAARACGKRTARLFTGEEYRLDRLSLTRRGVRPEGIIL